MKKEKNIGTLNEHTLHLALKNYIEPRSEFHEKEVGAFVADIKRDGEIFEIETCSFTNIRKKLPQLLSFAKVTVVYPISEIKWIVRIDKNSGETKNKRKSPKKGRPSDVIKELFKLKDFLLNPSFSLKIVFCEMTEYSFQNRKNKYGKQVYKRLERVPDKIIGERNYLSKEDYLTLLETIPNEEFVTKELEILNKLKPRQAWMAIKIFLTLGLIEECGKKGRAVLYKRSFDNLQ